MFNYVSPLPAPPAAPTSCDDSASDVCWVCLGDEQQEELHLPCRCPRPVHAACLARWQLQSAGRSEELTCRFCHAVLPDWRPSLTPAGLRPASPIMSIHHNGETHLVKVSPGPEGLRSFQAEVRRLLRLQDDQEFEISFECKVPGDVSKMELKGMTSYDAAVYCASITAAERLKQAQEGALAPHAEDCPASPRTPLTSSPAAPTAAAPAPRQRHSLNGVRPHVPPSASSLPAPLYLRPSPSSPAPGPAGRTPLSAVTLPLDAPSGRMQAAALLRRHATRLLRSCRGSPSCISPMPLHNPSTHTSSTQDAWPLPGSHPASTARPGYQDRHSAGAVPLASRLLPTSQPAPLTNTISSPGFYQPTAPSLASNAAARAAQQGLAEVTLAMAPEAAARPPQAPGEGRCTQLQLPGMARCAQDPAVRAASSRGSC